MGCARGRAPSTHPWLTPSTSQRTPGAAPPPAAASPLSPRRPVPGSTLPSPLAPQRMAEVKHLRSSPSPVPPTPSSSSALRFENCHGSRGGSRCRQPYMAPAPLRLPVRLTSDLPALLLPAPSRGCSGSPGQRPSAIWLAPGCCPAPRESSGAGPQPRAGETTGSPGPGCAERYRRTCPQQRRGCCCSWER